MVGFNVEAGECRLNRAYTATDTAFAECVDGNPYSRAAEPDMVIRWRGGDRGRGRDIMSLMNPVKNTPEASI